MAERGKSWLRSIFGDNPPAEKRSEQDQQVIDATGDQDATSAKQIDDDENWVTDSEPEDNDDSVQFMLEPYPSLLSTTLPPCGLIPQLAYENIVTRLRARWAQHAHRHSSGTNSKPMPSLVDMCKEMLSDVNEEKAWLIYSVPTADFCPPLGFESKGKGGPKQAKPTRDFPWRRQDVWLYEVRWCKYFIRESEDVEKIKEEKYEVELGLEFQRQEQARHVRAQVVKANLECQTWGAQGKEPEPSAAAFIQDDAEVLDNIRIRDEAHRKRLLRVEEERKRRQFMIDWYPIPFELALDVRHRNKTVASEVEAKWKIWHEEKRGYQVSWSTLDRGGN